LGGVLGGFVEGEDDLGSGVYAPWGVAVGKFGSLGRSFLVGQGQGPYDILQL